MCARWNNVVGCFDNEAGDGRGWNRSGGGGGGGCLVGGGGG